MRQARRVERFLRKQAADCRRLIGGEGQGAQRVAAGVHVPGSRVAKAVVVCGANGTLLMAVLPATERLDLRALGWIARERALGLVAPKELAAIFPDCAPGTVPPFGDLYGVRVLVDPCLRGLPEIVFPGGDGSRALAMPWREFERLAKPVVCPLCLHEPQGSPA